MKKILLFPFLFIFSMLSFSAQSQSFGAVYDVSGNVSRYCYRDSLNDTVCVVIDYTLMSQYELGSPLTAIRGIVTEYVCFYELGNGVLLKFKGMYALSGYELVLEAQIAKDPDNRTYGYRPENIEDSTLFLTKEVFFKMKETVPIDSIDGIMRNYLCVEAKTGRLLRLPSLNSVFTFCEIINATGFVEYCYPHFSTYSEAFKGSELPNGYLYKPGARPDVPAKFVYDASGNMQGRVIQWPAIANARSKKAALSTVIGDGSNSAGEEEIAALPEQEVYDAKKQDQVGGLNFSIYPNPTVGLVTVEVSAPELYENKGMMYVYDSRGKLIRQQQLFGTANQLDITGEKPGLYILHIQYEEELVEWKIIKN